uniref:Lipocalin/cytosolic fatty-acid binding domain-containing protein n=1 Tax=Amblyomma maculatum TaxID=34609 RepID=G3MKZ9_AMBMU
MKWCVVALIMAFGTTATVGKTSVKDLEEALHTYHLLWTVFRNFERDTVYGKHSCVYALPISLEKDDYRFYYGFNDGDWWRNNILYAKLQQKGDNAVFVVSETKDGERHPHTLEYWNPKDHCLIFTVMNRTTSKKECQLLVWEANLKARSPSAAYPREHHYDRICGATPKYTPYSDTCKK